MIRKLRKKLVLVLMTVVCLFLVGILLSMFISAQSSFEQRSFSNMRERPIVPPDGDATAERDRRDMLTASVTVASDGAITVGHNRIPYLTDDDLKAIVATLETLEPNTGETSDANLRYIRRYENNQVKYFLADTYVEREALRSQILYSCVIGVGALALFFGVSLLLSRWMIKPVESAWDKQRQFVADASHELKTPLTVILSNTDMLLASRAVTDEKNARRLDNIKAESQRMKGLVENLLTLARSDAKAEPTERQPVNFSFTVNASALTLEPTIFDSGRTLALDVADGLTVCGDAAKLRQLVDILLDNAAKYSDSGSEVRVALSACPRRELLLTVESAGEPLTPEECVSVFERFYRRDQSRGQQKGYGLGLSIAKSIVAEHKGRIWAQSDGARLNTFSVRLPCAEPTLPA